MLTKMRLLRDARQLSQWQVAAAVGCSQALISIYEVGRSTPPLSLAEKIAENLGVSVATLWPELAEARPMTKVEEALTILEALAPVYEQKTARARGDEAKDQE
jgi:transcriptional regulator with XRE-family HTH domain